MGVDWLPLQDAPDLLGAIWDAYLNWDSDKRAQASEILRQAGISSEAQEGIKERLQQADTELCGLVYDAWGKYWLIQGQEDHVCDLPNDDQIGELIDLLCALTDDDPRIVAEVESTGVSTRRISEAAATLEALRPHLEPWMCLFERLKQQEVRSWENLWDGPDRTLREIIDVAEDVYRIIAPELLTDLETTRAEGFDRFLEQEDTPEKLAPEGVSFQRFQLEDPPVVERLVEIVAELLNTYFVIPPRHNTTSLAKALRARKS